MISLRSIIPLENIDLIKCKMFMGMYPFHDNLTGDYPNILLP